MRPFTLICTLLLLVCLTLPAEAGDAPRYGTADQPTPVFNTPDFAALFGGRDGKTLHTDGCGQIRELEFVALPGTVFRIEASLSKGKVPVYRVTTDDYPYPTQKGYFIDSRFVTTGADRPPDRPRRLPPRQEIIDRLLSAQGSVYVWGGNCRGGVPRMLSLYPSAPGFPLLPAVANRWQLRGLDCSGLLYEATGGFTPRNTGALVHYGLPVAIAGLSAGQIVGKVEPLDLIVWPGHVMIILDRERVIESRLDCGGKRGGVRVRPLRAALDQLGKRRVPLDDYREAAGGGEKGFVIRRWYDGAADIAGRRR